MYHLIGILAASVHICVTVYVHRALLEREEVASLNLQSPAVGNVYYCFVMHTVTKMHFGCCIDAAVYKDCGKIVQTTPCSEKTPLVFSSITSSQIYQFAQKFQHL